MTDYYFESYAHYGIHEEMLKDRVRTLAYRQAILNSKHLFRDKIVLDVGCGTGILSMFAAQAGAKHVYAVDMSNIITHARQIVHDNGLSEKITLLQGKMEDIHLPVQHVDIIISEWMGYFLLYESMLDTVLYARDKYLAEGGLLMPDKATMYIAALEDGEYKAEKIDFWDNVYGFDMKCMKPIVMREPLVDTVVSTHVVSDKSVIKELDLYTVTKADLAFSSTFEMEVKKQEYIHALVSWFDIEFSACLKPVTFSTGPYSEYTHWKQTVFYLNDVVAADAGEIVKGQVKCSPNAKNPRELDIELGVEFQGRSCTLSETNSYHMC